MAKLQYNPLSSRSIQGLINSSLAQIDMLNRIHLVDLVLVLLMVVVSARHADASGVTPQDELRRERRAGTVRSTQGIEQIVLPQMPGMQYLGPEYDAAAVAYRLIFIRNGKVVFVDVDARSGRIIGRSR